MKKLISLLAVIALVTVLATAAFATEDVALVVDTKEAAAGEEVVINVSIVNNPGFMIAEMVIEYDTEALELVSMNPVGGEGWNWIPTVNEAIGYYSAVAGGADALTGDVVLLEVTLKVKEDAAPGTYAVNAVVDYLCDDFVDFISAATFEGSVVVPCTNHVAGEVVIENEVPATCSAEGSHDEVTYCTICGIEMSRENVVDAKLPHTAGEAVVENEVAGDCLNKATYEEVVYCSVCGEEMSRETKEGELGEHVAGEPAQENVVGADCQTPGSYDLVVRCTVCGEILSSEHVDGALGEHTPGEVVIENEVAGADCLTKGSYDEVVYCTVCGEELSRETKEGEVGEHGEVEYVDTKDGKTHDCVCKLCGETLNNEAHEYGEEYEVAENPGWKYKDCVKCGYVHAEDHNVPDTGDLTAVAFALVAVSGLTVIALPKKKEF